MRKREVRSIEAGKTVEGRREDGGRDGKERNRRT